MASRQKEHPKCRKKMSRTGCNSAIRANDSPPFWVRISSQMAVGVMTGIDSSIQSVLEKVPVFDGSFSPG